MKNRFVLLAVSALSLALSGCGQPAPTPTPKLTLPTVSAAGLNAEYSSNEVAADLKYKGKDVLVTGVVSTTGILQSAIALKDGVVCDFDSIENGEVLNLARNQRVTLKGSVRGLNTASFVGTQVALNGCTVFNATEVTQEKAFVSMSATALYAEHVADKEAANARYDGQVLEVNGVVADLGGIDYGGVLKVARRALYLTLETEGRWNVGCVFPLTRATQVAQLAKGQVVSLRGRYDSDERGPPGKGTVPLMVLRDCALSASQQTRIIKVKRMQAGSGCSKSDPGPVQSLDIEKEYLPVVVASENGAAGVPLEALKAQAVASRTFALYKIRYEPPSPSFDVCDTEADQVYNSSRVVRSEVQRAVEETRGIVAKWNGEVIAAFFVKGDEASGTARFVTVNEGKSGSGVRPTALGSPTDPHNRGAMGQAKAKELAARGWDYQRILRYFYGADLFLSP